MGRRIAKKVLLIGWDAADWKVINPLLEQGHLPALNRLINRGVMGNILTLDPPYSPMLWTSIATGKYADKHGILGFAEPHADSGGVRAVRSTSRKTRAIWNILHHQGYKCNVVGWWPSHPVEPINGVMVSNQFQVATNAYKQPWPMQAGTVHPVELESTLEYYRVHAGDLTFAHLTPFVPQAKEIDQKEEPSLQGIAELLASTASVQNAATWAMENTEWDFTAVYFDAIDRFCHSFMKYHPPQMEGVPDELFKKYSGVVSSAYRFHDMMLDRLLKLAGEDTTVILMSDHGFHPDHLRLPNLPKVAGAPALEHNPQGIIVAAGPEIQKDELIYGANLLDITPTILTLFGEAVGRDMDGKVLVQCFDKPIQPEYINSWDEVEGDFAEHPSEIREDPFEANEALQQLIDLGYVDEPDEDQKKAVANTRREMRYNLGRVYLSSQRPQEAIDVLEELEAEYPDDFRFQSDLIQLYLQTHQVEKARLLFNKAYQGNEENRPRLNMMEAIILIEERKLRKALDKLEEGQKEGLFSPRHQQDLGRVYLKLGRYKEAAEVYEKLLAFDPDQAQVHLGLAITKLRTGNYQEAAESALQAISLVYQMPAGHFQLGQALYHLERYEDAAQAMEVCLFLSPSMFQARQWLTQIYKENLNRPDKAAEHQAILDKMLKGRVTIVSGLPRSGTSLMMQMLDAGGMPVLSDLERPADESNPKGYFELEAVKGSANDVSWLEKANGKAVKVIAQLLKFLPDDYQYKVIFMERDMNEVLHSQQTMLGRMQPGRDPNSFPVTLAKSFEKALERTKAWEQKQANVEMIRVNYHHLLENPKEVSESIYQFLGVKLDPGVMAKVVDPSLYRSKLSFFHQGS